MFKRLLFFIFGMACLAQTASAQLSKANVYVFDLKRVADTAWTVSKPRYLTYFNELGYNNQPSFFSNNELYITAKMPNSNQTDIYLLDLDKKTKLRVTDTPENEFSPMRMPDYYNFSVLRQQVNGRDTLQYLWQYPLDRSHSGKAVFKYTEKIGYYTWLNGSQAAVYVLDNPDNFLGIADIRTDKVTPVATNIGRCLMQMTNRNLAFVQKSDLGDTWMLMEKNPYQLSKPAVPIVNMLAGCEDFGIMPDGTFLIGRGSKLYKFDRRKDQDWVEIADLYLYNIFSITRITVSNDYKVAIVTQ